jgi:hypothetical protein
MKHHKRNYSPRQDTRAYPDTELMDKRTGVSSAILNTPEDGSISSNLQHAYISDPDVIKCKISKVSRK